MGATTAQKMMRMAEVFGPKNPPSLNLGPSALYELAAPKTPIEVHEESRR